MQDEWYSTRLDREIAARPVMARAVTTAPTDGWFFPNARAVLGQALEQGQYQDDLLVVLQRDRISVERYAVSIGLSSHDLGETGDPKQNTNRRGHFEHDVVNDYLPSYLVGADTREIKVCFKLHARSAYRDALRQHIRRNRRRTELWERAPMDSRSQQELALDGLDDLDTVVVVPTHFAQWVPTPGEVHETTMLCNDLKSLLEPFDYEVAEQLMANKIVQGDKREIARLLGVKQGKISRSIRNIEHALNVMHRRHDRRKR